jgi:hypothetical protein
MSDCARIIPLIHAMGLLTVEAKTCGDAHDPDAMPPGYCVPAALPPSAQPARDAKLIFDRPKIRVDI